MSLNGASEQSEQEPAVWPPSAVRQSSSGKPSRPVWMGCLLGLAGGFTVLVLLAGALFVIFAALIVVSSVGGTARTGLPLTEVTVSGERGAPKVALVPVRGLLLRGGFGEDPLRLLEAMLDRAGKDEQVHAVILSVDSGGGGMTTCDMMHRRLLDYREETGTPVVALVEGIGASGAYYVSCAADHIIAHPTSLTGSIGVLMQLYDAGGLMEKVGVQDRTVKSGRFKDMGSPFAQKSREDWERDQEVLSDIIRQMHERFIQVVARERGLPREEVRPIADGRIFTGQEALQLKLVDQIGYRDDAVAKVRDMTGLDRVHVVEYARVPTLREMLIGRVGDREVTVRLGEELPLQRSPRPMYLWAPGAP
ncbi:MAG: signal peptide peptidase SppA [Candidatus Brocadiaceae bacterium]|jgi:protease-4